MNCQNNKGIRSIFPRKDEHSSRHPCMCLQSSVIFVDTPKLSFHSCSHSYDEKEIKKKSTTELDRQKR